MSSRPTEFRGLAGVLVMMSRAWLRQSLSSFLESQRRRLQVAFLAFALVSVLVLVTHAPRKPLAITEVTTAEGIRLSLLVADTPTARAKGLSGRDTIPKDGLILVWPQAGQHPIWMRGMKFPLDLIWLDETGRVLAIERNAPPCASTSDCPLYGMAVPSRLVVELQGDGADRLRIRVGDTLKLHALIDG